MKKNDKTFSESRAARNAWDEMSVRNELLPPEHFKDELAPREAYYDDTSHRPRPEYPQTGANSRALQDVVYGCCRGWAEPPAPAELYYAFKAASPTNRQLALLRTWFIEATLNQILEAWAQQAYTTRQLVRSIHQIGYSQTDAPKAAKRIRTINSWATER